jgi:hypothetical protein
MRRIDRDYGARSRGWSISHGRRLTCAMVFGKGWLINRQRELYVPS